MIQSKNNSTSEIIAKQVQIKRDQKEHQYEGSNLLNFQKTELQIEIMQFALFEFLLGIGILAIHFPNTSSDSSENQTKSTICILSIVVILKVIFDFSLYICNACKRILDIKHFEKFIIISIVFKIFFLNEIFKLIYQLNEYDNRQLLFWNGMMISYILFAYGRMIVDIKAKICIHLIAIIYLFIRDEIMSSLITQILFVFFILHYIKVIFIEYQRRKMLPYKQDQCKNIIENQQTLKKKSSDLQSTNNKYDGDDTSNSNIDFSLISQYIDEGIIIINEQFQLLMSNSSAEHILGKKLIKDQVEVFSQIQITEKQLILADQYLYSGYQYQEINLVSNKFIEQTKQNNFLNRIVSLDKINLNQISNLKEALDQCNNNNINNNINISIISNENRQVQNLVNSIQIEFDQSNRNFISREDKSQQIQNDNQFNTSRMEIKHIMKLTCNLANKSICEIKIIKIALNKIKSKYALILIFKDLNYINKIKELEENEASKTKMLAQITHELRTPLNCSIGMLDKLKDILEEEELKEMYLEPVIVSNQLLLNLVNDILDFSQMKANKLSLFFKKTKVIKCIQDIMKLIQFQAKLKKIDLQLIYDKKEIPQYIYTDSNRMRQIIVNLIGNSLKFTKKGFIKIILKVVNSFPMIVIKISVQDSGIGIAPEHQANLFKMFGKIQTKESLKLNQQGCGLGLTVANNLAKELGPEDINAFDKGLQVQSQVGNGATFSFLLADKQCQNNDKFSPNIEEESLESQEEDQDDKKPKCMEVKPFSNNFLEEMDKEVEKEYEKEAEKIPSSMNPSLMNLDIASQYTVKTGIVNHHDKAQPTLFSRKKTMKSVYTTTSMMEEEIVDKILEKHTCKCCQVLIVDDNQFNYMVLNQKLSSFFDSTDYASSGEEAIEMIKEKFNNKDCCCLYNIIFMDLEMPIMDGFETTRQIKQFLEQNKIKNQYIVACSGYSTQEEKNKSLNVGMQHYLTKPVVNRDLRILLRNIYKC